MDATAASDVGGLAGVLLHVGPLDTDAFARRQLQPTVDIDRLVVLRDLIVLGHVGIEVVLAMEYRRFHRAVQRLTNGHCVLDGLVIEHRQRTGQAEADRAHVGVGLVAESIAAAAEQLGRRSELAMHFETDDSLVCVHRVVVSH